MTTKAKELLDKMEAASINKSSQLDKTITNKEFLKTSGKLLNKSLLNEGDTYDEQLVCVFENLILVMSNWNKDNGSQPEAKYYIEGSFTREASSKVKAGIPPTYESQKMNRVDGHWTYTDPVDNLLRMMQ